MNRSLTNDWLILWSRPHDHKVEGVGEVRMSMNLPWNHCWLSADSLQTVRRDAEYVLQISAQVFTESRDGLPRNSSDFRK